MGLVSSDPWLVLQSEQNSAIQESVNAGIEGRWEMVDELGTQAKDATSARVEAWSAVFFTKSVDDQMRRAW